MSDTLFSRIIRREIPADIVYEDEHVLAFRDISPQAPVHVLFVPRKPYATLNDVPASEAELLGRLMLAMRDKEDRVRFSGYDVSNFKIFMFCTAAAISAIGGAMFTLQVGFMSPSFVGIVPSIEMVIFAAVGGRMSLIGAVYGALIVNYGKTVFSETFPELWLFLMGGLFIAVVMFFPNGLAGLYEKHGKPALGKLIARLRKPPPLEPMGNVDVTPVREAA